MAGTHTSTPTALDVGLLVDGIVRSTMILIAQITLMTGRRSTLGHIADQVFGALTRELRRDGLSPRVIADMFGMALRTYHDRVKRLSASHTMRDRTIWEAVFAFLARQSRPITLDDVFTAFPRDDERILQAVLQDLVDSGLAFTSGRGMASRFALVPGANRLNDPDTASEPRDEALVRLAVYRSPSTSLEELADSLGTDPSRLEPILARLVEQGRIEREESSDGPRWRCERYAGLYGDPIGFEAALFDHYRALVHAMCARLRGGRRGANAEDTVGGSTFTFQIEAGHPMEHEILGLLRRVRRDTLALWERLEALDAGRLIPDERRIEVVFYCGQFVTEPEDR